MKLRLKGNSVRIRVRVLLEKDFACIDRPLGEEADDAFPNPSALF